MSLEKKMLNNFIHFNLKKDDYKLITIEPLIVVFYA